MEFLGDFFYIWFERFLTSQIDKIQGLKSLTGT